MLASRASQRQATARASSTRRPSSTITACCSGTLLPLLPTRLQHSRCSATAPGFCQHSRRPLRCAAEAVVRQATTDASSSSSSQQQVLPPTVGRRGTAVVVGAGPAGATAAMFLADAGYAVHVLERRGHPGRVLADRQRTYLIGLGERGLGALDALGLSVPPQVGRPMRGSVYAYKSGKRIDDPFTPATRIVGVDRQGLAGFLVDAAQQRHPGAITFHWHTQPASIDLAGRKLVASQEQQQQAGGGDAAGSGQQQQSGDAGSCQLELQYDLLVGADGAGSAVRAAMVETVPGMQVSRLTSPVAEMEYKAFHDLPWNDAIRGLLPSYARASSSSSASNSPSDGSGAMPDGMIFFAFNNPQPNKPSPGSITLYLNAAGLWSGTLYQPPGRFAAMAGDVAAHEAAICQFTPDAFPAEWVPLMAQQMARTGISRINPMQLVSHLADPQRGVVLLGDAAHNVTPQMGQGCNSALEDAKLLAVALARSGDDVAAGLRAFEAQRMPQVHALQRMEEENAWVRRPPQLLSDPVSKTLARVAWISFFLALPLLRLLPGMKARVHASLFQNIMSTTVPYNSLHAAIRVTPLVLTALLAAVLAGLRAAMGLAARAFLA